MRIASAGQTVFATTMIVVGIMSPIKSEIEAVWQPIPGNPPISTALAYLCAFISVACGVGLLWERTAAFAARVLLVYLLLWLLVFRVPGLLHGLTVDVYWSLCKTAVMLAAAWVLYVWFASDLDKQHFSFATGDMGLRIARALYGAAIIPFGVAHFQYVQHTASMVPKWLPAHVAWVYFTGAAFMVAGMAVLIGVCARLATVLSTLQMGLFLALVWVPTMAARSLTSFEWGEVLVTWVLAVCGWVVADSYHDTAWLPSLARTGRRTSASQAYFATSRHRD